MAEPWNIWCIGLRLSFSILCTFILPLFICPLKLLPLHRGPLLEFDTIVLVYYCPIFPNPLYYPLLAIIRSTPTPPLYLATMNSAYYNTMLLSLHLDLRALWLSICTSEFFSYLALPLVRWSNIPSWCHGSTSSMISVFVKRAPNHSLNLVNGFVFLLHSPSTGSVSQVKP